MIRVSTPPRADGSPWLDDPTLLLAQRLAGAPRDGLVKGWLFRSIVESAKRLDVELDTSRRLAFKDYPLADYLELLAKAACLVQPQQSAKETLRLLGRGVYPAFAQSLVGKVIISGFGSGREGARTGLHVVTQVYKLTSNHAVANITQLSEGESRVELENVWTFPDSYHAGIFEGAAEAFGGRASVDVQTRSLCSATLTLRYIG
jgi:uncharacterized protein (TIGR02265 family)